MKNFGRSFISSLLLILAANAAQGSLILNGSFESGPFIGPSDLIRVPKPSSPSIPPTGIDNWVVTTNDVEYIRSGAFGLVSQEGDKFLDLTGGDSGFGTIGQLVELIIGSTYQLDFWIGGSNLFVSDTRDRGNPGVLLGITDFPLQLFEGSRNSANDWQLISHRFVAQQTNTFISFTGSQQDLCCYIGLDNVSLHKVPIPNTLALLIIGLALLSANKQAVRRRSV
jgi:hypothetical protein